MTLYRPQRRGFLRLAAAGLALPLAPARAQNPDAMNRRRIPSTGELLPVVGCGTWRTFDVGDDPAALARLADTLTVLFDAGGSVIDSSPMYGSSEEVAGKVLTRLDAHKKAFVATKVWTQGRAAGIAQMQSSMRLFQQAQIDLMQIHNLLDWRTQLATLRQWKTEGRIRYIGVTHYTSSAFGEVEAVIEAEPLDFIQINYAADDRSAEARLLPLAAERGVAVIVNQPFGGGGLLAGLRDKPLPVWASAIGCESWAQMLLKFVLAHPAVTCVIPGTGRPEHMRDNLRAGFGAYPDDTMRKRIVAAIGG